MAFRAVVTFERDGGDPVVWRGQIDEPDVDQAARRAVFRALPGTQRLKWESVVIVMEKV